MDFFIYTFTRTTNTIRYHEVEEDLWLKTLDIIGRHGAVAGFPTSSIQLPGALRLENAAADAFDPGVPWAS